jgi:hypothetical protein
MLPGLNFSLLDSNELDSERTLARLVEEYRTTRKRIMIPWVSRYETTKGREELLYQVYERFRVCPKAFSWALSTPELHQEEWRTRLRLRSVENRRQTLRFRRYLSFPGALPKIDHGRTRDRMGKLFRFFSPENSLERLMGTFEFSDDQLKDIRRRLQTKDRSAFRSTMVQVFRQHGREYLRGNGRSNAEARRLSLYPSFNALTFIVLFFHAMRWHVRPPSKENLADQAWQDRESADMETLEISLYGKELVTRDARLLEVREDVLAIVRMLW